jgi:uncharacterized protein (DUF2147 family)
MKRFCLLLALMMLSSSAYAGESFSFVIAGHRIRIESSSHCNSPSCVSVSIPGVYETRRRRYEDNDAAPVTPTKPPAPEPVLVRPVAPPASKPAVEPIAAPPPPIAAPATQASQPIVTPPPALVQPSKAPPALTAPPAIAAPPIVAARPTPEAAPQVLQISHEADDEPVTPLGDWKTEAGKGSIRIEYCGRALCGYLLDPASNAKAESVLINMKPKASSEWSGNVYSRDSGETYYGAMVMKGANSLRVEACALGRFFCSGNLWTRIGGKREKLITARQTAPEPRT